ncbi:hypothetical protein [Halopseudomonas xiamenensis]|uniref:hypothetical protein n=1 Tax=Halopseudomonas xiamenensis TaxID=157792 RepID=UPI001624B4F8|nr:hypothetical protein [Halopseudomonas xiamenensis]
MLRAYLDTEFTSLASHARLISLALVTSDGRELYLELVDNWQVDDCSGFVQDTVLPQLDLQSHGLTTSLARHRLQDFLATIAPAEIITDTPHWDWPLLHWLAGSDGLPRGVRTRALPNSVHDWSELAQAPHHALADARLLAGQVERVML